MKKNRIGIYIAVLICLSIFVGCAPANEGVIPGSATPAVEVTPAETSEPTETTEPEQEQEEAPTVQPTPTPSPAHEPLPEIDCDSDFYDSYEVIPAEDSDGGVMFDTVLPLSDLQCIKLPVPNGFIDLSGTWRYILITEEGADAPENNGEYDYMAKNEIRTLTFNPDGTGNLQGTPEFEPENLDWKYILRNGEIAGIYFYFESMFGWYVYPLEARDTDTVVLQFTDRTGGDDSKGDNYIRKVTLQRYED